MFKNDQEEHKHVEEGGNSSFERLESQILGSYCQPDSGAKTSPAKEADRMEKELRLGKQQSSTTPDKSQFSSTQHTNGAFNLLTTASTK